MFKIQLRVSVSDPIVNFNSVSLIHTDNRYNKSNRNLENCKLIKSITLLRNRIFIFWMNLRIDKNIKDISKNTTRIF